VVRPGIVLHVALRSLQLCGEGREAFLWKLADARHREEAKLGRDPDHGDPRRIGVVRDADHGAVRVGPDDRDLGHVAAERQQPVVVLHQRHGLVREAPRKLVALAGSGADLDGVLGDIWVVEEAERELAAQDAAHGLVELVLRELAAFHGPDERLPVAVGRGRLDVHPGRDAQRADLLRARGDELPGLRPADAVVVGHDRAGEPQPAAEQIGQDGPRGVDGQALELRVGRHDAAEPGQSDGCFEGPCIRRRAVRVARRRRRPGSAPPRSGRSRGSAWRRR
jgi:hypothetical protein